jgi:hypothetical protein
MAQGLISTETLTELLKYMHQLEERLEKLEEMLMPSKVHGETWSLPVPET